MTRNWLVTFAGLALIVVGVAVGVAGAQDSTSSGTALTASTYRPVVGSVQQDQAKKFAVFARERRATDDMPSQAKDQVGNSTHSGRNVDLSRAISTPTGVGWAVPGNNAVCLVVPDPVDGYGITCSDTGDALKRGVVAILVSSNRPGAANITMLIPRDSRVTATMKDGQVRALEADSDGVVSAALVGAKTISVITAAGTERLAMPVPPPAPPER